MSISRVHLLEAARLLNQMFHDSLETWMDLHFSVWRA